MLMWVAGGAEGGRWRPRTLDWSEDAGGEKEAAEDEGGEEEAANWAPEPLHAGPTADVYQKVRASAVLAMR